jgi:hypothetical protein
MINKPNKNMKLKEYIEKLNKLIVENPESLEMDVITSSDDEGNSYNEVHFAPSLGRLDEDGEFDPLDLEEGEDQYCGDASITDECNVVCLN